MNKNFKIVQINGLSGILFLALVVTGVFCGFVIFPIWIIMTVWNAVVSDIFYGPAINYIQAAMLWTLLALILYLMLKNSVSIKIQRDSNLSEEELKELDKASVKEESEEETEKNEASKSEYEDKQE